MLIPFAVILFFFLIRLTIKKAQHNNVNANKYLGIRVGAIVLAIALGFLIPYITEGRSGMLGALYLGAYLFCAWLLYLVVETISLFVVKQNKLAKTNLIIITIVAFIAIIVTFNLLNTHYQ